MADLTASCDWHDNDLCLQLPELPGRILVTLPDKRGREVYTARVHEYVPKDENDKLRKAVATAIKVQAVLCRDADSSYCRDKCPLHRPESNDCLACDVIGLAQELGIEV